MNWESFRENCYYGGDHQVESYDDFWVYCGNLQSAFREWRKGQTLFNALQRVRPDLAAKVRTSSLDTFYRDDRIPAFTNWLYEHWNDPQDAFTNCF
jgi:hypothetical protein